MCSEDNSPVNKVHSLRLIQSLILDQNTPPQIHKSLEVIPVKLLESLASSKNADVRITYKSLNFYDVVLMFRQYKLHAGNNWAFSEPSICLYGGALSNGLQSMHPLIVCNVEVRIS